jgi:MoxR-like ATPase
MTAFKTKVEAAISSGVTPFIFADSRLSLSSVNSVSEKAGMFVKRGDWTLFDAIRTMAQDSAANILMVGPSGTGKTSIPEAYAQTKGMPTYTIDCATIRDPEEWFGYREAVDGSTKFVKSTFIEAVEAGNTVIILDEFNRIEPWLHNSIYALLDHRRQTNVHGEMVKVGKGTIFAATANVGSAFTGTFTLDAALTNRFDATIFTSFLDNKIEAKLLIGRTELDEVSVDVIIQVMSFLRKLESQGTELSIDISTRTSLKIANLVKHSELPFKKILDYVILSLIEDAATVKVIMDGVNPIINSATTSPTTS